MIGRLTESVQQALAGGGSVALGLIMLAENLFPPIPSEIVLPYAGFLVGRGQLSFVQALLASTVGSVVGAVVLYAIGHYGGRPLVLRFRWLLRLSEADLDRADRWFDRFGTPLVFGARMVPIARSVVSLPAGWSGMPVWRFLALTTVGTVLWNALLIGAGAALGENYERVAGWVGAYQKVVLVAVLLGLVAAGVWLWRRRAQRRFPSRTG